MQDVSNGPRMGYASPQADGYSSYDNHWQRPEPQVTRGTHNPGYGHPELRQRPDADRLFADGHVHFEQQSPRTTATGFQDPRASYEAGPAYVYDTTDMLPEEVSERPHLGPAQWGGAIISLALILGLGVWGYKLMVRDVTGVPVIRAIEGAARVLPDEPGGQLAMHQGLAVNSVTADGSAAPPADSYVLAPAAANLSEEDQPMAHIQPVLSSYEPSGSAYEVQPPAPPLEQVAVDEEPLELAEVETVAAEEPELLADTPATNAIPVPMPKPRPVRLASLAAEHGGASLDGVAGDILAALGAAESVEMAREMAPEDVPEGSRLVQFGAYQSAEVARSEWERLTGRFTDLMDGKTRVIEKAESGGKTFYRLRAYGFADASDANRFCAAMTSMNAACTPTVQR
ncbi:SPOR domain-containing protein [Celeribacter sp. SCSIO 80788]|uniref:SPOR domain-containing protein n=1 Tax=Celeribacter sp. SCSIO 80788 TaxID=3117013 RepID=UPI003DA26C76